MDLQKAVTLAYLSYVNGTAPFFRQKTIAIIFSAITSLAFDYLLKILLYISNVF